MTKKNEDKLEQIPIIRWLVKFGRSIKIPGLEGLSLYDVVEMYVIGIVKGALTSRAGGIAFSFFMALFPFLLFIFTLIPFIPIEGFQADFIEMIENFLPPKTVDAVNDVIVDIANNRYGGLLSFGFIASVFLMTNGINAVLGGFEYSYHVDEMRSIVKQYFIAMGISLVLSFLLILAVAVTLYVEIAILDLKEKGFILDERTWIQFSRFVFFSTVVFVSSSFLYKYGTKKTKHITYIPGAILTTLLSILNFKLFAIYILQFSKYNEFYGSIGTLLVIMLFIWLNSIILLLGFELNATINSLRETHLKESKS